MITDQIKELEDTKAKVAELEKNIASQLDKELLELPAKYGFETVQAFIKAVGKAAGHKRKGRLAGAPKAGGGERRPRAVITDEVRAQVKTMVEEGKSGAEIAETLSISIPSVQNIKKALGLVKSR